MNACKAAVLLAACVALTGCPTTGIRPPSPVEPPPAVAPPDLRGTAVFEVDSSASTVHIQVFRGGALARLGHNHVVTSKHVSGRVWIHASLQRSGFELEVPVADLIVDDPDARAAAGPEFASEIAPKDRDGTRQNMLRAEVLDAERHPTIKLRSVHVAGSADRPQVTTRITIKGVARDVVVPATVRIENDLLTATGEFDIRQTDFGMKPFSVGLGALEVQDRLHIAFEIVGRR
jgi:polyisoprenoid-binding protein YceI